jgi:hypothetical protein
MMLRPRPVLAQRGVAAVEAAFLLIPLVILLAGVVEGGRLVYEYNTIAKSTRDAARYLSTVAPGAGHVAAACLAVHGNPGCTGDPLVQGLDVANVSICDATNCPATHRHVPVEGPGATGVVNLVTVSISGYQSVNYLLMTPTVDFDAISTTMRQAL